MALLSLVSPAPVGTLMALVQADGTGRVAWADRLRAPGAVTRDLADAVHALAALHGRHPGVADQARARCGDDLPDWLALAATAFADERGYLARLAAAAGPLPSTPGQAETEAAVAAQRRAFDMLAASDRHGCSLGAAAALVLDWQAIRRVLDAAATRFGVEAPRSALPGPDDLPLAFTPAAAERAATFAAAQVLAQHRGLWQLLESRAAARG